MAVELNLTQIADVRMTLVLMGDIGTESFFKPTQMLRIVALDAEGNEVAKVDLTADYNLRKLNAEWTPTLDWQRYPEIPATPETYVPPF